MTKHQALIVGAAMLALASFARAEEPAAPTIKFDAPVETLSITPHSGRLLSETIGVGDYVASAFTYSTGSSYSVFGVGKAKSRSKVSFTLTKADNSPLVSAKCEIEETTKSVFFVSSVNANQVYSCTAEAGSDSGFALEVVFPDSGQTTVGGGFLTITSGKSEDYRKRVGKMRYRGHDYDSAPTGYQPKAFGGRAVTGYVIRRDGRTIGEVDFAQSGLTHDHGSLTLPKDPDDREAVVVLGASLFLMPDPDANPR